MSLNQGSGEVTELRNLYSQHFSEGGLNFNQHANGVDWWIVDPLVDSNGIAVFLVDSSGVRYSHDNVIGFKDDGRTNGFEQSIFSPDGNLFIRHNGNIGTQLFDFDRETGALSNFRHLPMPMNDQFTDNDRGFGAVALSPSGQYLYVSNLARLYQYDLNSMDIINSRILIADLEYRLDPTQPDASSTGRMQLGPDCKIYVFSFAGEDIHVIHAPNEKGAACDWEEDGLILPHTSFRDQPYFPVFRIGSTKDPISPCVDYSAVSTSESDHARQVQPIVSVAPNPTSGPLTITLSKRTLDRHLLWTLYDGNGRQVKQVRFQSRSDLTIPREGLANGIYFWQLSGPSGILDRGKVIYQ
ncbi:hypothetical protein A3850_017810 [Lewinella sp. 4G2]|nr:hypothetical protein A3850_017810 [Lewinella sp. 4G2]